MTRKAAATFAHPPATGEGVGSLEEIASGSRSVEGKEAAGAAPLTGAGDEFLFLFFL